MHSPRKNPNSSSIPISIYNQAGQVNTKKKTTISAATQTETPPWIIELNPKKILNEDSKLGYLKALNYLNNCHKIMNSTLNETPNCGDSKSTNNPQFKLPEIPNYLAIFSLLVAKKAAADDLTEFKPTPSIIQFVPEIKQSTEFKLLEEKLTKRTRLPPKKPIIGYYNQNQNKQNNKKALSDICEVLDKIEEPNICQLQPDEPEPNHVTTKEVISELIQEQLSQFLACKHAQPKPHRLERTSLTIVDIPSDHDAYCPPQLNNGLKNYSARRPCTPKIVNDMFHRISNGLLVDPPKKIPTASKASVIDKVLMSDDGSIIFNDEEFEKLCSNKAVGWNVNEKKKEKKVRKVEAVSAKELAPPKPSVNHPFKFNQKDMSKLNHQVLSALGIFTEKGDLKPDVAEILQGNVGEQANLKDVRNKKFRTKRTWDVQVHLRPKATFDDNESISGSSSTTISDSPRSKSFQSVSSDINTDAELLEGVPTDCRRSRPSRKRMGIM